MPKALQPRGPAKRRQPARTDPGMAKNLSEEIRRAARPEDQADAVARAERAVELFERGDATGAAREAGKAKRLAPRAPIVREILGLALYGAGRWNEALAELKAYHRMSGRSDQNHLAGDCLRALGRPRDVIPLVEEELKDPKVPEDAKTEAVIVGASALADLGRFPEALAYLRRARTRDDVATPSTLRLWYVTGDVLTRAGRTTDAVVAFRKVLRHDAAAFDVAERLAQLGA